MFSRALIVRHANAVETGGEIVSEISIVITVRIEVIIVRRSGSGVIVNVTLYTVGRHVIARGEVLVRFLSVCFTKRKVSHRFLVNGILLRVIARNGTAETVPIVARSFHLERLFVVVEVLEATVGDLVEAGPNGPVAGTMTNGARNEGSSSGALRVMIMMVNVLLDSLGTKGWSQRDLFLIDTIKTFVQQPRFVHRLRGERRNRAGFLEPWIGTD